MRPPTPPVQLGPAGGGSGTPSAPGTWSRSWALLRTGWHTVRHSPTLLALAALATLVGTAGAIAALLYAYGLERHEHRLHLLIATAVLAFPLRLAATFLGVAMCSCAASAMDGERCTPQGALACAWRRRRAIVAWALVASTVGIVIDVVVERLPFGGRIAGRLADVAWSVVSFLALPVIALHDTGPRETVTRSARAVRERWGEGLTGTATGPFQPHQLAGAFKRRSRS
jgi:hypothetical protein